MADMTTKQKAVLLKRLENNLELYLDYYDDEAKETKESELMVYINSAIQFILEEGITLDLDQDGDCTLVTMYASWLYDKRKDGVAIMPRMLRYNLNNKLFGQKVKEYV